MEGFIALLIAGSLLIWLISHLVKSGERLDRLESQIKDLQKELRGQIPPQPPKKAEPAQPPPLPRHPAPITPSLVADPTLSDRRPDPVASAIQPSPIVPPPRPRPPLAAEPAFDWRGLLQRLNLWPPSGENAEAAIGAWWLTRIGLIVLIIAAVFFGVRLAQDVPPWVRLTILAGVAGGMVALGSWLERRLPAFGRLVGAGGLALGYFTAFAAYGIEATKVIADPAIGFFAQTFAVAAMIAWSLWKRDETVAAMSILLGFVACWFSHWHDLDQFSIAGLLTLAAGGGILLVLRQWRWPFGIGTLAAWFGFFVLAVRDWPQPGETPSLLIILGSLGLLTVILEAANFLAEECSPGDGSRWRHWLAVVNTSLAVGVGWLGVRLAFPSSLETSELDAFYLTFAILTGVFAVLRFWRKHSAGLTETYFLKASGLVALFVVEGFDGATRWLSLSVQTAILLWAWRRAGLKWIEAGFWVLLAATVAVIWHDLLEPADAAWVAFGVRHVVGTMSLALLAALLGLHGRWSFDREAMDGGVVHIPLRFIMAIAIGAAAVPLVMNPGSTGNETDRMVTLSLVAISIGSPAFWLRQFSPVLAGLAALIPAFFLYLVTDRVWSPHDLWTGLWLAALGLGLAELALHRWQNQWILGNATRLILQGSALVVLAAATHRYIDHLSPKSLWLPAMGALPYLVAAMWSLLRQSASYPASHLSGNRRTAQVTQWLLAAVAGLGLLLAFDVGLVRWDEGAALLAVGAGLLFGTAYFTKNHAPALAGGIPLLVAVPWHLVKYHRFSGPWMEHLGSAAILIAVCWTTAFLLWQRSRDETKPVFACYDFALHAMALLTLHWIFRTHLELPSVHFADGLTALIAMAAYRILPLPSLALASFLPIGLAIIHRGLAESLFEPARGDSLLWWSAIVTILGWIWLGDRWFVRPVHRLYSEDARKLFGGVQVGIGTVALIVAGRHAATEPWHLVALAFCGLLLSALGRFGKIPSGLAWSGFPLVVAGIGAIGYLTDRIAPPAYTLTAICLVAAAIAAHGVVTTWRWPREKRSVAWIQGLLAIALVFPAFEQDRLGIDSLTTVCWGLSAIALFTTGFATALRPYRLAGLIGLAIAIVRLFLVDIDDPLYRIYAFFAIAIVLLGMGYLYHRFRHLIERADRHLSGEAETGMDGGRDPGDR